VNKIKILLKPLKTDDSVGIISKTQKSKPKNESFVNQRRKALTFWRNA
jgi:hypothetical protein